MSSNDKKIGVVKRNVKTIRVDHFVWLTKPPGVPWRINRECHPRDRTVIDTASMATVLMEMSKSEDVFQTLGLPPRGKHNALEDIRYTLQSVKRMKELFIKGVVSELS